MIWPADDPWMIGCAEAPPPAALAALAHWGSTLSTGIREVRRWLDDDRKIARDAREQAFQALATHPLMPPAPWDTPTALTDPILRRWWLKLGDTIELVGPTEGTAADQARLAPHQRPVLVYDAWATRAIRRRLEAHPDWLGHPELEAWVDSSLVQNVNPLEIDRHELAPLLRPRWRAAASDPATIAALVPQAAQCRGTLMAALTPQGLEPDVLPGLEPLLTAVGQHDAAAITGWAAHVDPGTFTPPARAVWRRALADAMFRDTGRPPWQAGWFALERDAQTHPEEWTAEDLHHLWDRSIAWWPQDQLASSFDRKVEFHREQWRTWVRSWTTQWPRAAFAPQGPLWTRWCDLVAHAYQSPLQHHTWAADVDLDRAWATVVAPQAVPDVLDLLATLEQSVRAQREHTRQHGGLAYPHEKDLAAFVTALPRPAVLRPDQIRPWLLHPEQAVRLWAMSQMQRAASVEGGSHARETSSEARGGARRRGR